MLRSAFEWGLDSFLINASLGGPHENPMKAAIGCSRRIERLEPCEGVACTPEIPLGAVKGDDWKSAEKLNARE